MFSKKGIITYLTYLALVFFGISAYFFFKETIILLFNFLLILFIPGFILSHAFFDRKEVDVIERIAYAFLLSSPIVVMTILFSNIFLKIAITISSVVVQVLFVCLFFMSIIIVRKLHLSENITTKIRIILAQWEIHPIKALRFLAPVIIILLLAFNLAYPFLFHESNKSYGEMKKEYLIYDVGEKSFMTSANLKISHPNMINYDNNLTFLGHDSISVLKRGEEAHVTYYFRADKDVVIPELILVTDISNAKSALRSRIQFPDRVLKKGDIIAISNDITIPEYILTGMYTIHISLVGKNEVLLSKSSVEIGKIYILYHFDELYNRSIKIHHFYNKTSVLLYNVSISRPRLYVFENKIAFLGYDIDTGDVNINRTFRIVYYWKSLKMVKKDYTVFVHMTDMKGNIIFQQDHDPPIPTSQWMPGGVISEKYDVSIPTGIDEGDYKIMIGLYDKTTGKRLILDGSRYRDNAAYIGKISTK